MMLKGVGFTDEGVALVARRGINLQKLQNDIMLAQICERYHRLPSEVREEEYTVLMRVWSIQKVIDKVRG